MDILLNGGGEVDPEGHYAAILPEVQFTCSGRLLSWLLEESGSEIPSHLLSYRSGDQIVEMESIIKFQALQSE